MNRAAGPLNSKSQRPCRSADPMCDCAVLATLVYQRGPDDAVGDTIAAAINAPPDPDAQ